MPKAKLQDEADLESFMEVWAKGVRAGKYVAFYARLDKLLVLVPGSSTDPIVYGYMEVKEDDANKLLSKYKIPAVRATLWDWEAERRRAVSEE